MLNPVIWQENKLKIKYFVCCFIEISWKILKEGACKRLCFNLAGFKIVDVKAAVTKTILMLLVGADDG
jgi:hypothetical protein